MTSPISWESNVWRSMEGQWGQTRSIGSHHPVRHSGIQSCLTRLIFSSVGAAASAALGVGLCARPSATPAANPTSILLSYKIVILQANVRTMFSPVSSYVPAAGSWQIGNWVAGNGAAATLNQSDWSTGWVMVTQ